MFVLMDSIHRLLFYFKTWEHLENTCPAIIATKKGTIDCVVKTERVYLV